MEAGAIPLAACCWLKCFVAQMNMSGTGMVESELLVTRAFPLQVQMSNAAQLSSGESIAVSCS